MTEEDVKNYKITSSLQSKGWNTPDVFKFEYAITPGRVIARNNTPVREKSKFADYALFNKGRIIAVVEAKKSDVL